MEKVKIGDIRNTTFLQELALESYDIIIHLVSLDHKQSEGYPSFVASINISPIWSLLDVFSKKGLEKFIYFSTVQVYGRLPLEKITEQHLPQVVNAYGLTHLIGEEICDYYNRTTTVKCRVVRLSNSYGAPIFNENNCWWLVINDLCKQAYLNKEIILQSDGTPQRDFIHGWDVCQAVEKIMLTDHSDFLYQVSSGNTLTIGEIACFVKNVYWKRYGLEIPLSRKNNVSPEIKERYQIDNSLLRSTGFRPEWTLERGINDLFDFLERNNGK